jgi:hypothetical protein
MNSSAELIKDLIEHFSKSNEKFDLIINKDEKKSYFELLERIVPFTSWSQIDWSKVEYKGSWQFDTWHKQSNCVTNCLAQLPNSGRVIVVWSNANKPLLSIEIEVFKRNAMPIFDECMDTWVFDPNGTFVLECYHEGTISLYKANAT